MAIRRRLAEAYPDTLRPVLARSLLTHAWLLRGAGHTTALVSVIDEALDMTDDQDLVAAGARLLREERRSDPGSFDVVWAQQLGHPVPDWLRQEP